jgi:hypothetical protein
VKKFELDCGEIFTFEADSPSGVVKKLRELRGAFTHEDDNFLRSKAEVFTVWSGKSIRFDSDESFAEDLISAGMLREVSDGNSV